LNKFTARLLLGALILWAIVACSPNSTQRAGQGAKTGAVSGAVGGMVGALVFGGNVGDAAARGAVVGGAAGATAGGMSGAQQDSQAAEQSKPVVAPVDTTKLKQQIGEDNFAGVEALARCKHQVAVAYADTARASKNPDYALASLWIEILSYADQRDESRAREFFPQLIETDTDVATGADAEAQMQESLQKLRNIREQYGLPRLCA